MDIIPAFEHTNRNLLFFAVTIGFLSIFFYIVLPIPEVDAQCFGHSDCGACHWCHLGVCLGVSCNEFWTCEIDAQGRYCYFMDKCDFRSPNSCAGGAGFCDHACSNSYNKYNCACDESECGECDSDLHCDDKCVGDTLYYNGSCDSNCVCQYNTIDCNIDDECNNLLPCRKDDYYCSNGTCESQTVVDNTCTGLCAYPCCSGGSCAGECNPGSTDIGSCGPADCPGSRTRSCQSNCTWGSWSVCDYSGSNGDACASTDYYCDRASGGVCDGHKTVYSCSNGSCIGTDSDDDSACDGLSCGTRTRSCTGGCSQSCSCSGNAWRCNTDTDKSCTSYCDGSGNCTCSLPACSKTNCGCCADSYCSACGTGNCAGNYICNIGTHSCGSTCNTQGNTCGDCGACSADGMTCENQGAIDLQDGAGSPVSEVNIGETFYIYVGVTSEVDQVRFSSDNIQDDSPTGIWTGWFDWNTSSGDWDATTKKMAWSFTSGGNKEVWVEVKDYTGQSSQCNSDIYCNYSPVSTIYCLNCWGQAGYVDDPGGGWHNSDFTRYIYDCDSDGSLNSCEYYIYDNIDGQFTVWQSNNRTCSANCAGYNPQTVTVSLGENCPSQGENACTLGVRSRDNDGAWGEYDTATYNIDWEAPSASPTSPTIAQEGIPQTYSAYVSDNIELNYCWLYAEKADTTYDIVSMNFYAVTCGVGAVLTSCPTAATCVACAEYSFTDISPPSETRSMYAQCADQLDVETESYFNTSTGPSVAVTITANSDPQITSGPSTTTSPCTSPTTQPDCMVNFTVEASDPDGDSLTYNWDFGDGATSSEQNPSYHYDTAFTYTVTITISDGRGGETSDSINVTVTDPSLNVSVCAGLDAETYCANTYSGTAPLNGVDLKATVSGTMSGDINYKFDCQIEDGDCMADGDYSDCDLQADGQTTETYTATDSCNYVTPGNYTAKVLVEKGLGNASNTADITVSANQPPVAAISCRPDGCTNPVGACTGYPLTPFCLRNDSTDPNGLDDIVNSIWRISEGGTVIVESDCSLSGIPRCDWSLTIGSGNYVAELYVVDLQGLSNTTTQQFTIKQDAIADFRCSLVDLPPGSPDWKDCGSIYPHVDEVVYFLDQSSPSAPSEGNIIINRDWTFADGNPPDNLDNETNPSTQFQSAGQKQVTLDITDNPAGRSDSQSYTISVELPLPEWREVPPF